MDYFEPSGKIKTDLKEARRYMGGKRAEDSKLDMLLEGCAAEMEKAIAPRAVWRMYSAKIGGGTVELGNVTLKSASLSKRLCGADRVFVFGATLGPGADRLIRKGALKGAATAAALDACGSALIETFCDQVCAEMEKAAKVRLSDRFSPGYGDLPIEAQKEFFGLVDMKKAGIYLTDGMMMTPTKSVTAIAGAGGERVPGGCAACTKTDCIYKRK